MANTNYPNLIDDLEDDELDTDEKTPYSSVSSRAPVESVSPSPIAPSSKGPDPLVKSFLAQKNASSKGDSIESDPLMQQYLKEQTDIDDLRQAKLQSDHMANLGQAFSQLAQGVNAPRDNGVFRNIASQNQEYLGSKEKDADRKRKVMEAIQERKSREVLFKDKAQARKDEFNIIQEANKIKRDELNQRITEKDAEKQKRYEDEHMTSYGLARTADDAKQIKAAADLKDSFDRKLQEMIDLRTNHGGGATLNREDVARGKQLSKDLLLLYKDMAKLGVLSQSDEKILNAIIPSDPLEYNLSGAIGQDPTMRKLVDLKRDTNSTFNAKLRNRLKDPSGIKASEEKETSNKIIVSNGKETLQIDPSDLADAEKDGYRRL